MEKNKANSSLIVKSNHLIESSYKLGLTEMKIISKLTSAIQKDDKDFKVYRFKTGELLNDLQLWKNNYKELDIASDKLLSRTLTIKKDNWNILKINFLSSFEYKKQDWIIELCFDPKLKDYLLQLKSFFTSYTLRNIVSLKSYHSIRLYELLKQYEAIWEREIRVDALKTILGLDKHQYRYYMFKKRVILQAQYELEKYTDIFFEFHEIKEGRKVVAIKFIIHNQKQTTSQKLLLKDEKIALKKRLKEQDFYKKEDEKLQQSLKQDLYKKQLVSAWIDKNPSKYKKLLDEKWEVYMVRAFIQRELLKI